MPLEDGRYSVCRVIVDRETKPTLSINAVLVAGSSWVGDAVPSIDNPELRPVLVLSHHSFSDEPLANWVDVPPPDDFIPIGRIEPTQEEFSQFSNWPSHGHWLRIQKQALIQWRWDHDRDALLAEDAEEKRLKQLKQAKADKDRETYLNNVTLADLREITFFENWTYPPKKAVTESRRVMTETVEQLSALPKRASKKKRLAILQECIEGFNALDAKYEFIETVEREDICWEFEAIVHACGLGDRKDLADEWREW